MLVCKIKENIFEVSLTKITQQLIFLAVAFVNFTSHQRDEKLFNCCHYELEVGKTNLLFHREIIKTSMHFCFNSVVRVLLLGLRLVCLIF